MISNARRCNNVGLTNPKLNARSINHDGILCRYNSSNVSDINFPSPPPAWYDDDDGCIAISDEGMHLRPPLRVRPLDDFEEEEEDDANAATDDDDIILPTRRSAILRRMALGRGLREWWMDGSLASQNTTTNILLAGGGVIDESNRGEERKPDVVLVVWRCCPRENNGTQEAIGAPSLSTEKVRE